MPHDGTRAASGPVQVLYVTLSLSEHIMHVLLLPGLGLTRIADALEVTGVGLQNATVVDGDLRQSWACSRAVRRGRGRGDDRHAAPVDATRLRLARTRGVRLSHVVGVTQVAALGTVLRRDRNVARADAVVHHVLACRRRNVHHEFQAGLVIEADVLALRCREARATLRSHGREQKEHGRRAHHCWLKDLE